MYNHNIDEVRLKFIILAQNRGENIALAIVITLPILLFQ